MIQPHVFNETAKIKTVVFGLPNRGPVPTLEEAYDAKSYEAVKNGIYPTEESVVEEMSAVLDVFKKYDVEVLRPKPLDNYNQIFARDVSFTIDDTLFVANLIADRAKETGAFEEIFKAVGEHLEIMESPIRAEGGDILLYNDILFIGTCRKENFGRFKTTRTNYEAVEFFKSRFPHKHVIPLELKKCDTDPTKGILHLDCAFQPVGKDKAIIYPAGFENKNDLGLMQEIFGKSNLFEISAEEDYYMNTNIFSLGPDAVVSEKNFKRLNRHLSEEWGIRVEEVPYAEISKMGGLLRCSTMPLVRE